MIADVLFGEKRSLGQAGRAAGILHQHGVFEISFNFNFIGGHVIEDLPKAIDLLFGQG
jgi:hypothetical protein